MHEPREDNPFTPAEQKEEMRARTIFFYMDRRVAGCSGESQLR